MIKKISSAVLILLLFNYALVGMIGRAQPVFASVPHPSSEMSYDTEQDSDTRVARAAEPAYAIAPIIPILALIAVLAGAVWVQKGVSCVTDVDCFVRNAVISIMNATMLVLIGTTFTDLTGETVQAMLDGEWDTGFAFATASTIDGVYTNPPDIHLASGIKYWLSNTLLSKPPVYAQDDYPTGATVLGPVKDIHGRVRDVAYGFFMLVMVAIGFMIMLRRQIAPRVIISFTSALPKIFLSLLLLTLSFEFIGLTYDIFGNLASNVVLGALTPAGEFPAWETEPSGGMVGALLGPNASRFVGESVYTALAPFIAPGDEETTAGNSLKAFVIFVALVFFLVLAMFLVGAQLIFRLAKLLILTIFSPIVILISSLPGQEGTLTNFAKSIIEAVAAFPAIAFMFGVTRLLLRQAYTGLPQLVEPGPAFGGLVGNIYTGAALVFLIIVFMIMTCAAPMFVGKVLNPKK